MKNGNEILLAELIKYFKKLTKQQKHELLSFALEMINLNRSQRKRESIILNTW